MSRRNCIAVTGWSYGGYMTTWLIGHYHILEGGRAARERPSPIWGDQYNLSDGNVQRPRQLRRLTVDRRRLKAYREQSPDHLRATIKTPTLCSSTTGDARVPITQSYPPLPRASRKTTGPVHFIAYPVPAISPATPCASCDVYRRWTDWVDRHLK